VRTFPLRITRSAFSFVPHEDAIIVIVIDNKNNTFFIDDVFILVKYKKIFSGIYILIIPFELLRVNFVRLCRK
jgi:hypothetical protein